MPVAAGEAPPTSPQSVDPVWFNGRMEQKARSTLKEAAAKLGVGSIEEAAAIIAKAKVAEEASKTKQQKDAEERAALEVRARRADELEVIAKQHAAAELAKLTPQQQAYVTKRAGEDSAKILSEIDDLNLLLASMPRQATPVEVPASAAQAAPATAASKPPMPAPANTSSPPATPPATPPSAPNHLEVFERLRISNPFAATTYLEKHQRNIYAQIEARRQKR